MVKTYSKNRTFSDMKWQLTFRLSDRECAFNKAAMHNSNQGGSVCAAMLDAFGLFAQVLRVFCSQNIHLKIFLSENKKHWHWAVQWQFTVTVMHACMHSTGGSNHAEAGQTAGYGGYQFVGQSVDPPQAAKIQKPKLVQGDTFLDRSCVVSTCHEQLSYTL